MRIVIAIAVLLAMAGLAHRFRPAATGGFGSGQAASLVLVDPGDLDFGSVAVGAVERRTLIATNRSDDPIPVESVVVPPPFTAKPASFVLAPRAARVVTVGFAPREPGEQRDAVLSLRAGRRSIDVPLRALAARPPEFVIEPRSLAFGAVALGATARGVVTLRNHGDLPLHVLSISSPLPFRTDLSEVTLAAHESRSVEVRFAPDTAGESRAGILVRSDDPQRSVVSVELKGRGVEVAPRPVIATNPNALDFGRVSLRTTRQRFLWIRNQGVDPLHVISVTAGASFTAPGRGMRVAPGKAVRVPVSFTPAAEGGELVPLVIHSNDPEEPVLIVSLVGEGTRGESSPAPTDASSPPSVGMAPGGGVDANGIARVATPGAARMHSESADANAPAPPQTLDPSVQPDAGLVGEDGSVYVGTLRSAIATTDVQNWSFDPSSGRLSIDAFTPPRVQFPFGQYFEFEPIDIRGVVSETGDFSAPATVTMISESGTATSVEGVFTTGEASFETNGIQATRSGSALDAGGDGRIVFAGVGPDGSTLEKMPIVIEIPVAHAIQTTGGVVHAR